MDKQTLGDWRIGEMLRQRYALEVDRSAARAAELLGDVVARPTVRRSDLGPLQLGSLTFAVVAIAVAAFVLRSGPLLSQAGTDSATGSPTATVLPPTPGRTVGTAAGIPDNIDSQPVLTGAAIAEAIASSSDDTPFLIGGWFHVKELAHCASLSSPPFGCDNALLLYLGKSGDESLVFYPEDLSMKEAIYAAGAETTNRPVVLRIHTHDKACAVWAWTDCPHQPVADEIDWLGPAS